MVLFCIALLAVARHGRKHFVPPASICITPNKALGEAERASVIILPTREAGGGTIRGGRLVAREMSFGTVGSPEASITCTLFVEVDRGGTDVAITLLLLATGSMGVEVEGLLERFPEQVARSSHSKAGGIERATEPSLVWPGGASECEGRTGRHSILVRDLPLFERGGALRRPSAERHKGPGNGSGGKGGATIGRSAAIRNVSRQSSSKGL